MKSKVSPDLVTLLLTRIYLSRELKIFSLEELAKGWTITARTIYRYESPKEREYTRWVSKRVTDAHRALDKSLCQICGNKLKGHERCDTCTMLIHDVPECSCEKGCIVMHEPDMLLAHIKNV